MLAVTPFKILKLSCFKVAKKVTKIEKLNTKARLKSKSNNKNSVHGQPVPSSKSKGDIKIYFLKIYCTTMSLTYLT